MAASISSGLLLLAVALWNRLLWFKQGMWVAAALVLLPFTAVKSCDSKRRFLLGVVLAGLLAGFSWELLNNWAPTHWEYLILPRAPHLFEMPVAGYLGFIPFGLATAMVYQWQLRLRPQAITRLSLYAAALILLYALTVVYRNRNLWQHS